MAKRRQGITLAQANGIRTTPALENPTVLDSERVYCIRADACRHEPHHFRSRRCAVPLDTAARDISSDVHRRFLTSIEGRFGTHIAGFGDCPAVPLSRRRCRCGYTRWTELGPHRTPSGFAVCRCAVVPRSNGGEPTAFNISHRVLFLGGSGWCFGWGVYSHAIALTFQNRARISASRRRAAVPENTDGKELQDKRC